MLMIRHICLALRCSLLVFSLSYSCTLFKNIVLFDIVKFSTSNTDIAILKQLIKFPFILRASSIYFNYSKHNVYYVKQEMFTELLTIT